jgi:hypothetical protein
MPGVLNNDLQGTASRRSRRHPMQGREKLLVAEGFVENCRGLPWCQLNLEQPVITITANAFFM